VYLNGTEVYRDNMPTGTIAYNTLALVAIGGADESTFYPGTISSSLLVAGTNVIAVEIHQSDVFSSDISFDFELKATVTQPAAPLNTLTTQTLASALMTPPSNPLDALGTSPSNNATTGSNASSLLDLTAL
jgi:hypothetical protein